MKFTLFLFLLFTLTLSAQVDSEKKARYHIDKTFETVQNINAALLHAEQALYYAKKAENDSLFMEGNHALALIYKLKYDYKTSKEYVAKFLKIAIELDDTYFQMLANNLYGIINATEKKYQISIEYYNEAQELAAKANDTINVSLIHQNIALNYYFIDEFELAKMFMFKSLDTYNSIKVFQNTLQQNSDYIYLYMKLSLVSDTKNEAIKYTDLSIARSLQNGYHNYAALGYLYKGRVYTKYGNYELAIKNYQQALKSNKKAHIKSAGPYLEMMHTLTKMNQYEKAKAYMDTLYNTFSDKNIRPLYIDKYRLTSEVYKNIGDNDKALYYAEKRASIADSLLKHNNYDLMIEYGKKFETKEKENEIKQQQLTIEKQKNKNNNLLLYGFSSLFGVLLLFQWIYYTQRNKKRKIEVAYEKEHEFNQVRTAFLENISHEIRTPLTLINGYLNLIDEETNGNEKVKGYINNALTNSKKVIFDADEILNLLKFEDYKMSLKIAPKELNVFLKSIFLSFEVMANTRNIELIYNSKVPNNCMADIDGSKVEKILTNLVSNAIKFSDSNSKVIIEAEVLNEVLEVKVIDFGLGINEEDQERIFTRFYQSKNNKSLGGIGIGLLLAKDFAQFLGGNIIVESKIGKGSTFNFSMPISKSKDKEEYKGLLLTEMSNSQFIEKKKDIKITETKSKKPSILIVEDSIEMSNYLKEILSPFYNCTFAFDGLEAINLAKKQTFNLVASDIMMPKVDGYEFKKLLKSLPEYNTIPFILITAKSLSKDKIKGFSIGIDDYITKPFNKEELIVRINNLLKNNKELKLSIVAPDSSIEDIPETHVDKLLKEIEQEIMNNLSNENFKVEDLALKINYSQRQLARILNRYTGLSSIKFIQEIKLREAYKLIESRKFKTISEVQYQVGITSPSYFSEKFKSRFGINPSELFRKQNVES